MAKLEAKGIRKSFGENEVCKGIDLSIAEGEMVCLIGASGSGKSTLLRCLNLLEPIDDGEIWLDGTDISIPGLDPQPVRLEGVAARYHAMTAADYIEQVAPGQARHGPLSDG